MEMEKCYIELILWYFSVSKSKKIIQLFAQFTCFKMVKCGCYIKKIWCRFPWPSTWRGEALRCGLGARARGRLCCWRWWTGAGWAAWWTVALGELGCLGLGRGDGDLWWCPWPRCPWPSAITEAARALRTTYKILNLSIKNNMRKFNERNKSIVEYFLIQKNVKNIRVKH